MIPALIAGGVALASAGINAYNQYKQGERAQDMYQSLADQAADVEDKNQADINRFQSYNKLYYGKDADKYSQALQDFMKSPVYQQDTFGYQGSIGDYMDPARNQRVAAAMRSLEQQGADGGNSFSSDFMNRMAGKQQALASDEWANAYNRLVQDRQQQLAAYNANAQAGWNNYNANTQKAQYGIGQYGQARDTLVGNYGTVLSAGMQNRQAGLQSQANAMGGIMGGQNQQSSALGQLAGPAAQFAGAYFGAGSS